MGSQETEPDHGSERSNPPKKQSCLSYLGSVLAALLMFYLSIKLIDGGQVGFALITVLVGLYFAKGGAPWDE